MRSRGFHTHQHVLDAYEKMHPARKRMLDLTVQVAAEHNALPVHLQSEKNWMLHCASSAALQEAFAHPSVGFDEKIDTMTDEINWYLKTEGMKMRRNAKNKVKIAPFEDAKKMEKTSKPEMAAEKERGGRKKNTKKMTIRYNDAQSMQKYHYHNLANLVKKTVDEAQYEKMEIPEKERHRLVLKAMEVYFGSHPRFKMKDIIDSTMLLKWHVIKQSIETTEPWIKDYTSTKNIFGDTASKEELLVKAPNLFSNFLLIPWLRFYAQENNVDSNRFNRELYFLANHLQGDLQSVSFMYLKMINRNCFAGLIEDLALWWDDVGKPLEFKDKQDESQPYDMDMARQVAFTKPLEDGSKERPISLLMVNYVFCVLQKHPRPKGVNGNYEHPYPTLLKSPPYRDWYQKTWQIGYKILSHMATENPTGYAAQFTALSELCSLSICSHICERFQINL